MKNVTETIGKDYTSWEYGKPILIHAQTGTGKTTFVLKTLLPYAIENDKQIVYFTNRTALKDQITKIISETEYKKENIIVCNYQSFTEIKINQDNYIHDPIIHAIRYADYYIFDEAHYFLADADFNRNIPDTIDKIKLLMELNRRSIWIYMTATIPYLAIALNAIHSFEKQIEYISFIQDPLILPEPQENLYKYATECKEIPRYHTPNTAYSNYIKLKRKISELNFCQQAPCNHEIDDGKRRDYFQQRFSRYDEFFNNIKSHTKFYFIGTDYSYINPVYYNKDDDLIKTIIFFKKTNKHADEKWLVFVDNITDGEMLLKSFLRNGIDSVFISSKNRHRGSLEAKEYRNIIKNERFDTQVLIATKVLDHGININDPNVKHIVIKTYNPTSFLQMLGRRRRLPHHADLETDKINVYFQNQTEKSLVSHFKKTTFDIAEFLHHFSKISSASGSDQEQIHLENFFARYTINQNYKNQYYRYIKKKISQGVVEHRPIDWVTSYSLIPLAVHKLSHDYYHFLSVLEHAQNERNKILQGECQTKKLECPQNPYYELATKYFCWDEEDPLIQKYEELKEIFTTWYKAKEETLKKQQYMWIREQLSWVGIAWNNEDSPLHPKNQDHWITEVSGSRAYYQAKMESFLSNHQGCLRIEYQNELKQIFQEFVQYYLPEVPYIDSKGSFAKIQECIRQFFPQYSLSRKNVMRFGGTKRNWWFITKKQ